MVNALKIVLADDDKDDRFLFSVALKEISIPCELVSIPNGEKLMSYLVDNIHDLPDMIFLDLNMPRKNGSECLTEIKLNRMLKHIPVIIYSTSSYKDTLDLFYKYGASYCIRKPTVPGELSNFLKTVITATIKNEKIQSPWDQFLLGAHED